MNIQQVPCPGCERPVFISLSSFPLSTSTHQKFDVRCPLCQTDFFFGYLAETYEKTVARLELERIRQERQMSRELNASEEAESSGSEGVGPGPRTSPPANDQRSNIMNPNNPSSRAAANNRSNQMNPNNAAYRSSRGGRTR